MSATEKKLISRNRRHIRIRKKVSGTSGRPRLCVSKSLKHIYAQIINDDTGATLVSSSTMDKDVKGKIKTAGDINAAKAVGAAIAEKALGKDIKKVVFDRGGYIYHGRIKALAEAAREKGLQF
ncbi:MAG: 50S ribosomal protein L18 [Nitrospirae bacterium RBG_19FT_COMBO_42_15]|nr:MAG: 50S ribosomal protein L18 [Nitrospirae bacterium RBG_19FT_COMBO_42_15]